jgi:hypothetical protein
VEQIESMLNTIKPTSSSEARAAVLSSRRESFEAIAEILQQLGMASVWRSGADESDAAADVVVSDGWESVSSGCYAGKRPPRLLLLHFPREEDFVRAKEAGIDAVAQMPLLLSDLAGTLDKMVRNAGGLLACGSGLCE